MSDHCLYEKIGFIGDTVRMRYKSSCGLDVVQMDHEVWDGAEYKRRDICGTCMKCKRQIKIKANEALQNKEQ